MPSRKRILVVGGVAGGMSFAARARRLDNNADIIVFEKGDEVSYANCGLPYFVSGEIENQSSLLVQTPASLKAALDLDVRTGHLVTGIDTERRIVRVFESPDATEPTEFEYDELVLSPGMFSGIADYPGVTEVRSRLSTLRTVPDAIQLESIAQSASSAVVLGGGYIGVEAAEALRSRGLEVHLVQRSAHVLTHLETELASYITTELEANGVVIHANAQPTGFSERDGQLVVALSNDSEIVTDHAVIALGGVPATQIAPESIAKTDRGLIIVDENGRTSAPNIWAVGDAVTHVDPITGALRSVALAGPANRDGRYIADAMLSTSFRPRPAALGTSIVRVFGLAAGATGANSRELIAAGIPFETLHLHANSHAGYFPGSEAIHLVAYFATDGDERGRIYGAQAVGRDGIDKRIDVIATAIRGGMTIDQLADLDLSYAPPFGSAKDAVQMVGFVAQNVLDGTTTLWQARDLEKVMAESLILDVRRADEFATGHLPGALNVPHTELRERLDEVIAAANGRPVRAHCAAGIRSYLAHRVLDAAGLDSATLSGGMQTLIAYHGKDILTHEDN